MIDRVDKFKSIWEELSNHFSPEQSPIDQNEVEQQLSCLYFPGPSFHFVFDYRSKDFIYVDPDIISLLGYNHKNMNPELLLSLTHEDDIKHVLNSLNLSSIFIHDYLPTNERLFYKIVFNYRLRTKSGKYLVVVDQQVILPPDKNSRLSKLLVNISDISKFVESPEHKLSFIDMRGMKSYFNVKNTSDFIKKNNPLLNYTPREIEIIRFISEGMSTEEMSNYLFLSKGTIRTHRNNILKKSKENKITKVICDCIKEGII